MHLQKGVHPVQTEQIPRLVEIWEASVRATHRFITDEDLGYFKSMVEGILPDLQLACVRAAESGIVGFVAAAGEKVEMLFVHPVWCGMGIGRRLLFYAVDNLGATSVDVNEQNEQAVGFYFKLGFEVAGRSEVDSTGKPYPILHLQLKNQGVIR